MKLRYLAVLSQRALNRFPHNMLEEPGSFVEDLEQEMTIDNFMTWFKGAMEKEWNADNARMEKELEKYKSWIEDIKRTGYWEDL